MEPYDISNRDGNHNSAYREDYSVIAPSNPEGFLLTQSPVYNSEGALVSGYLELESGSYIGGEDWVPNWTLSGAVYLDRMQESLEKFKLRAVRGRYVQVTITNNQGRIKVDDVSLLNRTTGNLYHSKI